MALGAITGFPCERVVENAVGILSSVENAASIRDDPRIARTDGFHYLLSDSLALQNALPGAPVSP